MPNYISYSPWQDAAAVGRGLGQTLGDILFGVPKMKHDMEQQRKRTAIAQQRADAEMSLIPERAAYYRAQSEAIPQKVAISKAAQETKAALDNIRAASIKQQTGLFPDIAASRMSLNRALTENANVRSRVYPEDIINERVRLLQGYNDLGETPPEGFDIESIRGAGGGGGNAGGGLGALVAPLIGGGYTTRSLDSKFDPDNPPDATHIFKVRNKKTGEPGWADVHHLDDPEWERVR